jgi:hypothetical protein
MPKKELDFYEVYVNFKVRKDYWHADNDKMNSRLIIDKVQSGIEVPIEDVEVKIVE